MSNHECRGEEVHDAAVSIREELLRESPTNYAPALSMIELIIVKFLRSVTTRSN